MKSLVLVLLLLGTPILLTACSEDELSAEDEIRSLVEAGAMAAENRSLDDLAELMHENYRDQKGYNKKQLRGLLRAYFFRHKNIHLFTRFDEIDLISANQASVSLYVAMAGSVISSVDQLSSLRAQIYRFELQLLRDDRWLVQHASWEPASLVELQ